MNVDGFWRLIDKSRRGAATCEDHADRLTALLKRLPPSEIEEFDRLMAQRRIEAYRWDLWAVAYIINGGCSNDGFEYFRCWLISKGRRFFEACLASPEHAGRGVEPGDEAECEAILYAAAEAHEQATGQELRPTPIRYPAEPRGQPWTEEALDTLYPGLSERFG